MAARHCEYHYKSEGSDTVVVFVHGIEGSPAQFDYMIEKLNGAYSIENLLLPGHGFTKKEFSHSSMAEWQGYVDEKIKQLQNQYKHIILVGHSMGCLLSVQAAISYPQKISGLFLTCIPLCIRVSLPYLKRVLNLYAGKNNNNEYRASVKKGNSVSCASFFGHLAGTPRYIELFKKIRLTRKTIGQLELPVMVVQSQYDEIVSFKSVDYIAHMKNVKVLSAEGAGHVYFPEAAQAFVSKALLTFISKVTLKSGAPSQEGLA
ncbi:MAG: alpha/beta fold hydrolase [Clostridiales bacterium]|nr:alpha/beta fold hydrolase [Clostridiales bacterium]